MLAYVFWHRRRTGGDVAAYDRALRAFHDALDTPSACFRLTELPFPNGDIGHREWYEDWYLVETWQALGDLSESAVDAARRRHHDAAGAMVGPNWGGLYALARGKTEIPYGAEWLNKPMGKPSEEFVESLPHEAVWRRQLVLGPAPEFCVATDSSSDRVRII